jgi:hypothetical protein
VSVFPPRYDGPFRSAWANPRRWRNLVLPGSLTAPFALTRTGAAATAMNADGSTFTTYAANTPRFNGSARGLLIEGPRTNLFLNSATGVTQNVTVTAALHALSFVGTGSVTLTGTSTAGPLAGTGANNRVQLTFTPTAGTLTLTVAGDVRAVNLELVGASLGGASTSWIVTTGASVARGADLCSASLASLGIPPTGACTIVMRGMVPFVSANGAQAIVQMDDGTANNRYFARFQPTTGVVLGQRVLATVTANMTTPGTLSPGAQFGLAMTLDGAGRFALSFNGGAVQSVTGGPTALTTLRLGMNTVPGEPLSGECRSLRVLPYSVPDAALPGLAAP